MRGELRCRYGPHCLAIHRLGLEHGVEVGGVGLLADVTVCPLAAGWEALDELAGDAVPAKGGSGVDADGGAAADPGRLERQRPSCSSVR